MDIKQMQYLAATADARSVTKAAESFGISQSAMSHYISKMERDLGVKLFDRSTNPIRLTRAGEVCLETARRVIAETDDLARVLRDISNNVAGSMRVIVSPERAACVMPRLLSEFAEIYPGISVEVLALSGGAADDALMTGRGDLMLSSADAGALSAVDVCDEEFVIIAQTGVVSADMRIGDGEADPSVLDGQPLFTPNRPSRAWGMISSYLRSRGVKPIVADECPSWGLCIRMASAGLGFAVVPRPMLELTTTGAPAEVFSFSEPKLTRTVRWLHRKDARIGDPERGMMEITKHVMQI